MKFVRFIFDIFNVFTKANEIRQDDERRQKTVRFAVSSIIYSLISAVFVLIGTFLMSIREESGILIIFIIIIAVILFVGGLLMLIGSLLRLIAQFTLNLRSITWLALAILVIAVTACVITILKL